MCNVILLYSWPRFQNRIGTTFQRSCGKVMFSVMFVHKLIILSKGIPYDHYPWCKKLTSTYRGSSPGPTPKTWDPTVQRLPWPCPLDMGSHCTVTPSPTSLDISPCDLTIQVPLWPKSPYMGHHWMGSTHPSHPVSLLVTSGGKDWTAVQNCSLEDFPWVLTSEAWSISIKYPTGMFSCCYIFQWQKVFLKTVI